MGALIPIARDVRDRILDELDRAERNAMLGKSGGTVADGNIAAALRLLVEAATVPVEPKVKP